MYAKYVEMEQPQTEQSQLELSQVTEVTLADVDFQDEGEIHDPFLSKSPYSQGTQQLAKSKAPQASEKWKGDASLRTNYPQFVDYQSNQGYMSNQPYASMTDNSKPMQMSYNYAPPQNRFNDIQMPVSKEKSVIQKKKQNYYNQRITGATSDISRTPIVGAKEMEVNEFDDYFEKHVDKFFTPEIDEIHIHFTPDYLFGIQFCYRDSWGREERETYKGERHMNKQINYRDIPSASIKLEFDELVKEVYTEGNSTHVTYLKIVTNKKQMVEFGYPSGSELKNLLPEFTNLVSVGGSYGTCITNIYFCYS